MLDFDTREECNKEKNSGKMASLLEFSELIQQYGLEILELINFC